LEDLPAGFVEIPATDMASALEGAQGESGFDYEAFFMFMNPQGYEIVLGFTAVLTNTLGQTSADMALSNPDLLMSSIVSGISGGADVIEQKPLTGLDNIGDASTGISMLADIQGTRMRFDIALFRQDTVLGILMIMYQDGVTPSVSIQDLTHVFDQRVIDVIQPAP
jgi:hypothetical protein